MDAGGDSPQAPGFTPCDGRARVPVAVTVGMDGEVKWWRQGTSTSQQGTRGRPTGSTSTSSSPSSTPPSSSVSSPGDPGDRQPPAGPLSWDLVMTRKTGSRGSPSGPLWTVQAQCRGVFAGAANGTVSYFGCGGELRRTFRDPARRHQVLCLRAVGRCLLTGGSDGMLRAYHVPSGRIVWRLRLMRQRDGIRRLTVHGGTVFALGKFGEMRCVRLDRHWDGPRPRRAAVGSSDAASGAWAGGAPGGPGSGETGWPPS